MGVFCLGAQTITNRAGPFTGTSIQAAEWIVNNDHLLRSIAKNVSKVITYSGKTDVSGDGVTLLLYDFADLARGQVGTVLEITENSTGNAIYVVWSNEAVGSNAIFSYDPGKIRHDVSFSSRNRRYGMSGDTVRYINTIIRELRY